MQRENRLRKLRRDQGMSMQELQSKAEVSISTLTLVELYMYVPGRDVRRRLAEGLGVAEGDIWPGIEEVTDDRRRR